MKIKRLLLFASFLYPLLDIVGQIHDEKRYTYSDVKGIWIFSEENYNVDCENVIGNRYVIFNNDNLLFFSNSEAFCDVNEPQIYMTKFGFSDAWVEMDVDTLHSYGCNLVFLDHDGFVDLWASFKLHPQKSMFFYNRYWEYMDQLPQQEKKELYKHSLSDHYNYARKFLDYDICGVNRDVYLLDNNYKKTKTIISKGEIVTVKNTEGDFIKVEYEDIKRSKHNGFLKKSSLQFVETDVKKSKKQRE